MILFFVHYKKLFRKNLIGITYRSAQIKTITKVFVFFKKVYLEFDNKSDHNMFTSERNNYLVQIPETDYLFKWKIVFF